MSTQQISSIASTVGPVIIIIIIIIINKVQIIVTLSWITLQGHLTKLMVKQRNEVEPGKVSVTPTSVQKAMSSGGSGTTEVMGWWRNLWRSCSMTWYRACEVVKMRVSCTRPNAAAESVIWRWRLWPSVSVTLLSSFRSGTSCTASRYSPHLRRTRYFLLLR